MYPSVTHHHTPPLWARGPGGPARFGSSAGACHRSRSGDEAGRSGSTTPHPESPRPSQDAQMPARSSDRATFFSHVVRIRTRDPVFRSLPIGLKTFESTSNRFIPDQALRHTLGIAHVSRQGQRPHARGLAIEARRLRQDVLEAFTLANVQHGRDCFGTIRLPSKPSPPCSLKAWITLRTVCTAQPTSCAIGFGSIRRALASTIWARRTRKASAVRRSASNWSRSSSVKGRNKERWFQSPSILRETPLHKNSCGDALTS